MEKHSITAAQQFNEDRFTKINMMQTKTSTAFVLNFLPGQAVKPHNHPNRELYLQVLEGNGTFSIDGEDVVATAGDVFHCDPEELMGFTNTGESNVSIFVTMSKISEK